MKKSEVWPKLSLERWEGDACSYGDALNAAGWAFIEEWWEACPDKPMPAAVFNHCKRLIRAAIRKYAIEVAEQAVTDCDTFDIEATALQKRVDELEAEVADLKAQIKAWEDA